MMNDIFYTINDKNTAPHLAEFGYLSKKDRDKLFDKCRSAGDLKKHREYINKYLIRRGLLKK